MRVRKFKSFGKIQGGHAHFWPWEFFVKNSKSLYINNHGMWVLHTHVFWHGKSIYTISFTLRPSPDPFLTTPMPYRGIFLRKIQNFRISIIITCGYSTAMFFDMRNRFTLLVLHSNHHLTHFWIHAIPWEFSHIYINTSITINFRISITITCGYSTPMFLDMKNRFTLLVLHSDHHLTQFWPHSCHTVEFLREIFLKKLKNDDMWVL